MNSSQLAPPAIQPGDWQRLPDFPGNLGVAGAFAGVTGGSLLVAGGANFPDKMPWDGGIKTWHDAAYVLDRPDGSWVEVGQLPIAFGQGVSVTTPDGVVCVGGCDLQAHYRDVFRLTVQDGRLVTEVLPSLPIAAANSFGALVEGTLYVAGGNEKPGEKECVNRAFTLDLSLSSRPAFRVYQRQFSQIRPARRRVLIPCFPPAGLPDGAGILSSRLLVFLPLRLLVSHTSHGEFCQIIGVLVGLPCRFGNKPDHRREGALNDRVEPTYPGKAGGRQFAGQSDGSQSNAACLQRTFPKNFDIKLML